MTVTLRSITRENLWPIVDIELHPGQERFVDSNMASITNICVERAFAPLGICR